jgi:hypothetical protein
MEFGLGVTQDTGTDVGLITDDGGLFIEADFYSGAYSLTVPEGDVTLKVDEDIYAFHTNDIISSAPYYVGVPIAYVGDLDITGDASDNIVEGQSLDARIAPYIFDPDGGQPEGTETFQWVCGGSLVDEGNSHIITQDDLISGLSLQQQTTNAYGTTSIEAVVCPGIAYTEQALTFAGTQGLIYENGWTQIEGGPDDVFLAASFIPQLGTLSHIVNADLRSLFVSMGTDGSLRVVCRNKSEVMVINSILIEADEWSEGDRITLLIYVSKSGAYRVASFVNGIEVKSLSSFKELDGSQIRTDVEMRIGVTMWDQHHMYAQVYDLRYWENLDQIPDLSDAGFTGRFVEDNGVSRAPEVAEVVLGSPTFALPLTAQAILSGVSEDTTQNWTVSGEFI